tara:strand:+ start:453 stop:1112 length:660 start_codon:yes stop_codon:yes gene_type:complete
VISAVIPAKKTSVRLPNKNMRPFKGTTLLGYKIKKLQECEEVGEIIVGSDCDEILAHAEQLGAIPVKRPDEACDEEICSANKMIGDLCGRIKTDVVVWTHCTNPNISAATYDHAIETFLNNRNYDSLISVDLVQEHLWKDWGDMRYPLNYNPWAKEHTLAKDLSPLYKQNGAFFIQSHENALKNSYFFGENPQLFLTDLSESTDINTEIDFKIAEFLAK